MFATDVTNASRTMLMNLHSLQWDKELCDFFGVEPWMLPEIRSNAELFGSVADGALAGVPIAGVPRPLHTDRKINALR